ncbi:hypothetical protein PGT21_002397 [Puccinia graminis f. sp. tritici]|uniref:Uncharacterized protein n=1 Tax=Puccinia graminis f. sp. tritici TaxID=56615 RepID=A0A5B0QLZ9_PUCGR|nr:hypothetical protein PGT21_002397 [Puccinia graminis f. sp. tritici]KAA1124465.1 hypothetical protein PGTUg99_033290 [Puccinia graminis f. sp. tritici]
MESRLDYLMDSKKSASSTIIARRNQCLDGELVTGLRGRKTNSQRVQWCGRRQVQPEDPDPNRRLSSEQGRSDCGGLYAMASGKLSHFNIGVLGTCSDVVKRLLKQLRPAAPFRSSTTILTHPLPLLV